MGTSFQSETSDGSEGGLFRFDREQGNVIVIPGTVAVSGGSDRGGGRLEVSEDTAKSICAGISGKEAEVSV